MITVTTLSLIFIALKYNPVESEIEKNVNKNKALWGYLTLHKGVNRRYI